MPAPLPNAKQIAQQTLDFIRRCAKEDGSYAASRDPNYPGNSDTASSDPAAVTYAFVLARTMAWELPHPDKSAEFVQAHQQPDGRFINRAGKMDPKDPLAVLYNTTQGVVALRAMGHQPQRDPSPVMTESFREGQFKNLPWYTTSFSAFPERRATSLRLGERVVTFLFGEFSGIVVTVLVPLTILRFHTSTGACFGSFCFNFSGFAGVGSRSGIQLTKASIASYSASPRRS